MSKIFLNRTVESRVEVTKDFMVKVVKHIFDAHNAAGRDVTADTIEEHGNINFEEWDLDTLVDYYHSFCDIDFKEAAILTNLSSLYFETLFENYEIE